ncbi:hypothetical protein [Thermococcus sp. JdF3]|uniref:hypothetical protein n=1 Tax=Thermococcus sp. JdF3 TaxID=1638258 RepID=UPI00143B3A18|nr:hypothetical protein [Thermococcus sp. JdF3]NJE01399.1 hypothetical protein [Thermococcus sp. JdF3]
MRYLAGVCGDRFPGGDLFVVMRNSVVVFSLSDYPAVRVFFGMEARAYLEGLRTFEGACTLCTLTKDEAERLIAKAVVWFDELEGHLQRAAEELMEQGIEKLECDDPNPSVELKILHLKLIGFRSLLPVEQCKSLQTGPELIDGCFHIAMVNERIRRLREP